MDFKTTIAGQYWANIFPYYILFSNNKMFHMNALSLVLTPHLVGHKCILFHTEVIGSYKVH